MIDVKEIQDKAQAELNKERIEKATKALKELLKKKEQAQLILRNIDREIADYTAELGHGNV